MCECVCVRILPSFFDYKKTAFLQLATLSFKYSWILAQFRLFSFSLASCSCSSCYFLRSQLASSLPLSLSLLVSSFLSYSQIRNHFDGNHFSLCSIFSLFGLSKWRGWRMYMNQTKLNRNDSARKSIVSLYPLNNGFQLYSELQHTIADQQISSFSGGLRLH